MTTPTSDFHDESRFAVHEFANLDQELDWVTNCIAKIEPHERWTCAVLARHRRLIDQAVNAFEEKGVATYDPTRPNEFNSFEFRWLYFVLKLANSRSNRQYLQEVCVTFQHLENTKVDIGYVIAHACINEGDYLRSWVELVTAQNKLPEPTLELIENSLKPDLLELVDFRKFQAAAIAWFDARLSSDSDENEVLRQYREEKQVWNHFVQTIIHDHRVEFAPLNTFLQEIDLQSRPPIKQPDAVTCATIHSSGGMNFRHVYLIGMVEGELPSQMAFKKGSDSRKMEEERRICFTAITRTQDSLTLTYSKEVFGQPSEPSRFLSYMGLIQDCQCVKCPSAVGRLFVNSQTKIDKNTALELLRKLTNDPNANFRSGQWEAIDRLVNHRKSMVVVQRTGWGKSTVYFIATRFLRDQGFGPTLIVSPLLALMRNQIEAASRLGLRAETINSSNSDRWEEIGNQIEQDLVDVVLISPERLANVEFMENYLPRFVKGVGLLVVDETHCISDCGHDFRPDYRRFRNLLRFMGDGQLILGTTATANDRVIADVRSQLGNIPVSRGELQRESISLQNMYLPTKVQRLAWLADHIHELNGTGIIYTLTVHDTVEVSNWLQANGVDAPAYYSGVVAEGFDDSDQYRSHLEYKLLKNEVKALVSTTALGMGFDKPDVGFVVHYQMPGSVIAYYQQVGRAGRAIKSAHGILMSGQEDDAINKFFRESSFPNEIWVERILQELDNSDGLTLSELESKINLKSSRIAHVLKYLSVVEPHSPVTKIGYKWSRTPVHFELDRQAIQRITNQREDEWQEMQQYIEEKNCLMEFLLRSLNQPNPTRCGKCSNCLGRPVIDESISDATFQKAVQFLSNPETKLKPKIQVPYGVFPEYGFRGKFPENLIHEIGRIMSRWGNSGVGKWVSIDKYRERYRNEIVDEVERMYKDRWHPTPKPGWITCVGSRNENCNITDFAKRLSVVLRIPFRQVVFRTKANEYQKKQHNKSHQCRNLDGVFEIRGEVDPTAVLLVDDVYDSGWTLAIISALLLQAGSGPVFPLALASATSKDY